MSTQTLREGARLLAGVLVDTVQIFDVGDPVTVGFEVTRPLTPVGTPVPGLVQSTTLENAVESRTEQVWSIKVSRDTPLAAGQAVQVISSVAEPELVGRKLVVDKVSLNGAAMIRKGVASDFETVNQEGKEGL
jgi:hypothetical protein